jgi:TolB-like protein/Tfp pilus assembly protein PilF
LSVERSTFDVERSAPHGAVFLSYASQDAEAARRISEALRAAGIEVWFDQHELRGGDAWDQNIRQQIKGCTLFLPIISAQTQARAEGYFRREWKLADQRTEDMGRRRTFLVPVCIDDTHDAEADVPDSFLKVQWMRLPHALPTPQFVAQIKRLLDAPAKTSPSATPTPRSALPSSDETAAAPLPLPRALGAKAWVVASTTALAVLAGVLFFALKPVPAVPGASAVEPAPAAVAPPLAAANDKSIAVLPFANMSDEKDGNAFFADGVHEDILTNLAYIRDLRVVSRTSVAQYRDTKKPIGEIARELKVAYVLEGSVRRAGNRIRVTGQLIRAANDEHVWAKAYDRDVTDVFAVQGELAQAIAAALQTVIAPATKALLERRPTENPAAYDAYLKARRLLDQGALIDEDAVISLLQQAVETDPNFAAAWAMLGGRHAFAYFNRDKSAARLAQAKSAIDTAAQLAPDDPEIMEGLGDYYYYGFRDYTRAAEQYRRLAQLRPNDAAVFASLSYIARRQGRFPEAVAHMKRARQLDPESGMFPGELMLTLMSGRKYDEAIAAGRDYLQRHPEHVFVAAAVAQAEYARDGTTDGIRAFARRTVAPEARARFHYLRLTHARTIGDWAEAIRLDREQRYFDGDTDTPRWMQDVWAAATLAEAGELPAARARATEALAVMNAELVRQPLSPHLWASLSLSHALLGNKAEALRCVDQARAALPESRDALQGPIIAVMTTSALAWAGETERALVEFERLLRVPFGTNPVLERGIYFGSWKPLRSDPRFEALLADPKNNGPLF